MDLVYNNPISLSTLSPAERKNAPPNSGGAKRTPSDLGDLDLNLVAQGIGLDDAVNDGLVVQDLAGGHSCSAAVLHSIHEGTQLLVEQVAGRIQGDLGEVCLPAMVL